MESLRKEHHPKKKSKWVFFYLTSIEKIHILVKDYPYRIETTDIRGIYRVDIQESRNDTN